VERRVRRKQKKARSIRDPVDWLIKTAKISRRKAALEAWAAQERAIVTK
jgi:hypothetical protein